jgi:hypothetical protein
MPAAQVSGEDEIAAMGRHPLAHWRGRQGASGPV